MDISNDGDNAMITIIGAIDAIKPDVECTVYDSESIDNFTVVWGNPEDEIERSVIVKKYNDMQEEWNSQAYARKRQDEYPDLAEQFDLLFHDMTSGKGDKTGEWYKAVNKVKTDNPKG
jgi:hypothetical protein